MANSGVKRRRQGKRLLILAVLLGSAGLSVTGHWLLAGLWILFAYLANELLGSDHIFYPPASDYSYRLHGDHLAHHWQGDRLQVDATAAQVVADTILLEVSVTSNLIGRWFDPRVRIEVGDQRWEQYLERGARGQRYLNLSGAADALRQGNAVVVRGECCDVDTRKSTLWGFNNGNLSNDNIMVLAPHADDAEIAAFGLYGAASAVTLVTVTAGETETDQYQAWVESKPEAARFKGEVRSHDSMAAAIWAGLGQRDCINLGYGCLQLQGMQARPEQSVTSPYSGLADTRPYRRFNSVELPTDSDGATNWRNLVDDLTALLKQRRPTLLVAPHPQLDSHNDHRYATLALHEAVAISGIPAPRWALYANHLDASQDFPFGPAHSGVGLPPSINDTVEVPGVLNVELDSDLQRRKALALDLMHDLKRPTKWKKWWRKRLQRALLGRPLTPYGEDDFFRKAVRRNELFIVADNAQVGELVAGLAKA